MWKEHEYEDGGFKLVIDGEERGLYWPDMEGWHKDVQPGRKLWYWSHWTTNTQGFAYTEEDARKIMEALEGTCVVA